jgi:hypothetical protein
MSGFMNNPELNDIMRRRKFIPALVGAGIATLSSCSENSGNRDFSQSSGGSTGNGTETINVRVGSFLKKNSFAASKSVYYNDK